AWTDGPLLAATLVEAARALGADVRAGRTARILDASGDAARVELMASSDRLAETLEADLVVVAAGRWSDQVAGSVGARAPLAPTSGLLAVTSPLANGPARIAYLPGVHLRPDAGGRLVLQDDDTDAQVGPETPEHPDLPGCRLLLERARAFVPALADARVEAARVGTRALPADGYPIVGPAPEAARLYLAVTHSGMTLGPLLGEIVSAELLTGRPDPRLSTFRPGRESLAAPARP
ncbi:MAG TPA: FAD-dependent oxidoreductase, partial [Chloroflexota bacterium]